MIRILPLFLALTMLVGSVGVTVNRHFCMGELKTLTLFGKSEACEMEAVLSKPACPMHAKSQSIFAGEGQGEVKKGCCDDESEFVSWDDDRQLSEIAPLPPLAWMMPVPPASLFPERALYLRSAALPLYQNYRPPPLVIDVPSRWQVFRL
ncbi:HYC_CC_PP family protein [Lewinella sp. IMCC34191]|uniref:HYC_CC_PP family protein n=1 Tax=Lewinella sp. IMCC34191 TaxID=2259172 RepID=UPI000E248871|nr:hypothetical protein [Lewinella sp. IMCC34191]